MEQLGAAKLQLKRQRSGGSGSLPLSKRPKTLTLFSLTFLLRWQGVRLGLARRACDGGVRERAGRHGHRRDAALAEERARKRDRAVASTAGQPAAEPHLKPKPGPASWQPALH